MFKIIRELRESLGTPTPNIMIVMLMENMLINLSRGMVGGILAYQYNFIYGAAYMYIVNMVFTIIEVLVAPYIKNVKYSNKQLLSGILTLMIIPAMLLYSHLGIYTFVYIHSAISVVLFPIASACFIDRDVIIAYTIRPPDRLVSYKHASQVLSGIAMFIASGIGFMLIFIGGGELIYYIVGLERILLAMCIFYIYWYYRGKGVKEICI